MCGQKLPLLWSLALELDSIGSSRCKMGSGGGERAIKSRKLFESLSSDDDTGSSCPMDDRAEVTLRHSIDDFFVSSCTTISRGDDC